MRPLSTGLILAALWATSLSEARITVVSSTCVTRIGDAVKWLSCPRDATGFANSLAELHNDLETVPSEQRFCCGQSYNRYCCNFAQKVAEDPNFDESSVESNSQETYVLGRHTRHNSGVFGFWANVLWLGIASFSIFFIVYCFGTIIFDLLLCLCSCCWKKDGQYNNIEGGQNEKVSMVVAPAAAAADSRYNAVPARVVRPPTVTADLYQNVGSSPPPYTQALR